MGDIIEKLEKFNGTIAGEHAAMYYADLVNKGSDIGGAKGLLMQSLGWTGGILASSWTPDTALDTALTLLPIGKISSLAKIGIKGMNRSAISGLKFFYNNEKYAKISKSVWVYGANGKSLHHWLIPQRWTRVPQGIRNAGFNMIELSNWNPFHKKLGLNQWMGFAPNWVNHPLQRILARTTEFSIRIFILSAPIVSPFLGAYIGVKRDERKQARQEDVLVIIKP